MEVNNITEDQNQQFEETKFLRKFLEVRREIWRDTKSKSYQLWLNHNKEVLDFLYINFLEICEDNDFKLIEDDNTKSEFYKMMYEESTGELLNKNYFSDFFTKK